MVTYHQPRAGAIACGALCAVGAAAILLEDIRHTHTVTLDHLLAVIVLVGTIAAGVMAVQMLATWRTWHYAAALSCLFAVGSVYCVMGTAGRTAEGRAAAQLAAESRNQARAAILAKLAKADTELDKQREAHAAECKTGKGKNCDGIFASVTMYETAVKGLAAELAAIGPEVPVNTRTKNAAAIVAALSGGDAAHIEAVLRLVDPNIGALFLEAGSILFLHVGVVGWRRGRQGRPLAAIERPSEEMSLAELRALQPMLRGNETVKPEWDPTPPRPRRRKKTDERRRQVADFRSAFVKRHGREPEPREVRAAVPLPRSTSHRYLRELVPLAA